MADTDIRARSRSPPPISNGSPAKVDGVRATSRSPVRSPKRNHSRSRSPRRRSRSPKRKSRSPRRRSRSPRRRSRSPRRRSRRSRSPRRSPSRSPSPCKVLGVFGLHPHTSARDIEEIFIKYGDIDHVDLITDRDTGKSKCFGFVYYNTVQDAAKAKEGLAGLAMDGRTLRIDFSYTKKAHSPTPGQYLGRSTGRRNGGGGGGRDRGGYGRRDNDRYDRFDRHDRYDRYNRSDRDRRSPYD